MKTTENVIREHILSDDLRVVVCDATSHYYGGYYHVCLLIQADVELDSAWFDSTATCADARRRLGGLVRFARKLEKMAVPESDLEEVRQSLLESYEKNVLPYVTHGDFPRRFVLSEYTKALQSPASIRKFRHG